MATGYLFRLEIAVGQSEVDNNGLDVHGSFHSDRWGDFRTYFKFHLGDDGKFSRLDIGQE